jgi:methane/ammonia monooxygenase subunit B
MRRWILMALVALLGAAAMTGLRTVSVSAHGEIAQEGFVRMQSLGWWDVKFSKSDVTQNENVVISGTAKVLETWPSNMSDGNPKICYLTVVEPGARFVLVDRKINGNETPQSFFCEKGGVYNFSMTLRARDPGNWHVHPAVAVKESGTLIGPGQYINISSSPSGFTFPLALLNGNTIDLESYGTWLVLGFSAVTLILGMWWMFYWTVPGGYKRTITRLRVANELPLNQDGGAAVGLITKRDHRMFELITGLTVVLVAVGFIWASVHYSGNIPLQVQWVTPPAAAQPAQLASAQATNAIYDPNANTVQIVTTVTNTSTRPVQVSAFRTGNLSFLNPLAGLPHGDYEFQIKNLSPQDPIAPGSTQQVTITLDAQVLKNQELLPLGQAQYVVAGVMELTDGQGTRNFDTVQADLNPTST